MRKSSVMLLVLLAAFLATAGCATGPSDEAIATDIKARMFSDAQLKTANVQVTSKNGEVTLTGEVSSEAARYAAFKLAADTKGVVKVNDQLTLQVAQAVEPPAPAAPEPKPVPVRRVVKRAPAPAPVERSEPAPVAVAAPLPPPPAAAVPPPPEPKPVKVEIPVGSTLAVRMIDSIDSEVNRTGETFRATLDSPISVEGPSARISPELTISPGLTSGF